MTQTFKRLILLILLCFLAGACAMPQVISQESTQPHTLQTQPAQEITILNLQSTISALQTQVEAVSTAAASPAAGSGAPAGSSPTPMIQPSSTMLPSPTPTPLPTATAVPAPTSSLPCNRAEFVADESIPDGTYISNGAIFTKIWRLRNSGACAWTTNYALVFDQGYSMGQTLKVNLGSTVLPGQTIDVNVTLTAPGGNGDFQGFWKLQDEGGNRFGIGPDGATSFWVLISTGYVSTSTPAASGYCSQVAVSPVDATFSPGNELDMRWTITNISGWTWSKNNVDYIYVSGTKMYKYNPTYDLNADVPSGSSVDIIVDTVAPTSRGYYSTTWALMNGSTTLCYLSNTIYVK